MHKTTQKSHCHTAILKIHSNIVPITCIAITSGSRFWTNLEKSVQLFLILSRRLFAFHVTNFEGSFFEVWSFSSLTVEAAAFSVGFSEFFAGEEERGERAAFLQEPSFSTGLKNLFIFRFCKLSPQTLYCAVCLFFINFIFLGTSIGPVANWVFSRIYYTKYKNIMLDYNCIES